MTCSVVKFALRLIVTLGVSVTGPLAADPLSGERVSELIIAALADAEQGGVPALSLHRGFPPCASQLEISPSKTGWSAVDVICPDIQSWTRRVRISGGQPLGRVQRPPVTTTPASPAIVLTESLPKGTILSIDHLTIGTVPGIGQDGQIIDLDTAVGRRLKVNLGAGQGLLARHLDHDWLVREGSPVTIQVRTGPILIETGGIALQSGQLGEAIKVSNARSGRALYVTVIGPNKTRVRPNIR